MAEVIHNAQIVIDRIAKFGPQARSYMQDVTNRAMHLDVWPKWTEHISLQDHSLEDLRKLGHPYSTRLPADSFVHPDWEVHEQSGSLLENSRIITERGSGDEYSVAIINTSPHYVFLRYGTTRMRIRDPAGHALADALPAVQRRFNDEIKSAIIKIFASK